MIDFHSHILPNIDDGSKSVSESIELLRMLSQQGISAVAATPHFTPTRHNPRQFLEERQLSFERLKSELEPSLPAIRLGAEVFYYRGIRHMQELPSLCLEGTRLLLLEMPTSTWNDYAIREILELSCSGEIIVVLAHIERYWKFQDNATWNRLYESGIQMQVNASFFTDFTTRRKAMSMLKNSEIHLIGSDCHNLKFRPPNIGNAYKIIEKKFSKDFADKINEYGKSLLI